MNVETGQLVPAEVVAQMSTDQRAKYIEVKRDLTRQEELTKQIAMYAPCGCGSGKKLKFCCHKPAGKPWPAKV